MEHARAVADRLAVALAASRREELLLHQANYDPLTDLPNRNLFMQRLESEIARRPPQRAPLRAAVRGPGPLQERERLGRPRHRGPAPGRGGRATARRRARRRHRGALGRRRVRGPGARRECRHGGKPRHAPDRRPVGALSHRGPTAPRGRQHRHRPAPDRRRRGGGTAQECRMWPCTAPRRRGAAATPSSSPACDAAIRRRTQLEAELRVALDREQFLLVYQPMVRLDEGSVAGVEALLRWRHPERGIVPPSEFIGVLEDSGLIDRAGLWVLRTACEQYRRGFGAGARPGASRGQCLAAAVLVRRLRAERAGSAR